MDEEFEDSDGINDVMEQMDVMMAMLEGMFSRLRGAGFSQKTAEKIVLEIIYNQ